MEVNEISVLLERLDRSLVWLPSWAISLMLLVLAVAVAWLLHRSVYRLLDRMVAEKGLFLRSLVQRTEGPARLAFIILGLAGGSAIAPLQAREAQLLQHILLICFIALAGWVASTAIYIWTVVHLRRFKLDSEDNLLARKHVTQTRILRRTGDILIALITASVALMTFESVRQYGVSLLASAGAAGLILGLALQPLLKNLIAGVQLAVTQPIRIDDALVVEGEWGWVEEITSTYVVLRLWDWRRLILPLNYFIEQPFQNWTRETASLIGTAMLYADYRVPVPVLRDRLEEIARESALWDGQVVALQVTDLRERTMELRMLVSASNAGRAFDLRCEVREKMIAFLQAEYPDSLPRRRQEIVEAPSPELEEAQRQPAHVRAGVRH